MSERETKRQTDKESEGGLRQTDKEIDGNTMKDNDMNTWDRNRKTERERERSFR